MTHPTDISAPQGVEVDEFGDRENENELCEYVRFVADMTEADVSSVAEFTDMLREDFPEWEISGGGSMDREKQKIELRRVYHRTEEEPPVPDEILERQREKEAEYYKKE